MSSEALSSTDSSLFSEKLQLCKELKTALSGDIGDIVAKHQEMILRYYDDVHFRARKSFDSAKTVSRIGFAVLITTLAYTLIFDALAHFNMPNFTPNPENTLTVGSVGVVSGLLIEFIAGINFYLYGRAMRQFNAFHICLERANRYLTAYKMAEKIGSNKDETLEKLVCIMANAPMITAQESHDSGETTWKSKATHFKAVSSEVEATQ